MNIIGAADEKLGDAIEDLERRHHARRLSRIGWAHALRGEGTGWGFGGAAVRDGNHVEVLIDGSAALPAIAGAVRAAKTSVHVAGWAISPDFAMVREPGVVTVRDLFAEAAERVDVRVLIWAGAPLRLFHPSRSEARSALDALLEGTSIRGALDSHNRPMHCHHEKLVIIDGAIAFVGGIDLTSMAGDRYDGPHGERDALGWHDAAACLRGPAVADVAAHFAMRWEVTTGERVEPSAPPPVAGTSSVQVVRTVPEKTYPPLKNGEFTILQTYIGALRAARQLIYIENQFLWSAEVVAVLRRKLLAPPTDEFRLCVVLPLRPNNGNDDTRGQLGVLMEADRRQRLLVGTIGPPGRQQPAVYVHAKVAVIDDHWLTVGSANLNEHSLFNDTEVNIVTDDPGLAVSVRERLWTEHIGRDCTGVDPLRVIDEWWRPLVREGAASPVALRRLPSASRRSARLLGPLKGLFVDG
ncbi:MAG: phosphatidylserine/phosphatidylglycerophosphate/cardiolipin synthase family protein [Candidatus Dormibacteraeota bacterium]|nr:phosphatidylserine/phosphatidylglycerophosphate/cardiolipin synthase family protein [Candidatus Dormibacteraeota bacterium]